MRITATGVTVTIGGRAIVTDESVTCEPGRLTALIGPSGCGKTTLLHALGLLVPVSGGSVCVDGVDMTRATAAQRRRFWRDSAAFVLQDYGIIDDETVAFNVALTAARGRQQHRIDDTLARTGLSGRNRELASCLSGGEKQRLALARVLYRNVSALFVDEPTASLDLQNRRAVAELLTRVARAGVTVVVATHDEDLIADCDVRHRMTPRAPQPSARMQPPAPDPSAQLSSPTGSPQRSLPAGGHVARENNTRPMPN